MYLCLMFAAHIGVIILTQYCFTVKNGKKIPTLAHFCMKFLKYISKTLIENLLSFELLAPS